MSRRDTLIGMQAVQQYASVALIGWASGLNLYLATALAGICGRAGWLPLPGDLKVLEHPLVIGAALLLYAIEFVADKVPFVDSFWDSFHTIIRPVAAAGMGYMAGSELGPVAQTALSMGAGTFALNMHAVKASSRLAINTSPEPFSNITASLAEDSAVLGMFYFFVHHPWLALAAIVLILVLSFFLLRLLWKFVKKLFKAVFGLGRKTTPANIAADIKGSGADASAAPGPQPGEPS